MPYPLPNGGLGLTLKSCASGPPRIYSSGFSDWERIQNQSPHCQSAPHLFPRGGPVLPLRRLLAVWPAVGWKPLLTFLCPMQLALQSVLSLLPPQKAAPTLSSTAMLMLSLPCSQSSKTLALLSPVTRAHSTHPTVLAWPLRTVPYLPCLISRPFVYRSQALECTCLALYLTLTVTTLDPL